MVFLLLPAMAFDHFPSVQRFRDVLQRFVVIGLILLSTAVFAAEEPKPLHIGNLHNMFAVTPRIYSGSVPEGETDFAELAKLGVKTVISVDGTKPDVEAAKKHGLAYVHLPFGYDGIPTNRVADLALAMKNVAGPVYVHCHHGKHRGPAAVAVMCLAGEGWTTNRAEAWLRTAGTADDYAGLYRDVRGFVPPSAALLASRPPLTEVAKTSSVVDAMVAIDEHSDRLKAAQKVAWKEVPGLPDVRPSQEAVLLWEQLRELGRHHDTTDRTEDYRKLLADSESAAATLRDELKKPTPDPLRADEGLKKIGQSCTACHKKFRN
jgi:protein tyrosine phosphatase (PTP) superfamily phosphohydrolase (DUF442 family)